MPVVKTSRPIDKCQICGSTQLESVLFVGFVPPVNMMRVIGSLPEEEIEYPLGLLYCPACTLVQIGLEVDANVLFPPSYPYLSGSTRILRENFADLCRESSAMLSLKKQDLVIDIGSNDGTLLSNFQQAGYRVLGVDPTDAAKVALSRGIPTDQMFFGLGTAKELKAKHGQARVITAANVFAHIGNVHNVVDGILELLAPNGTFISESHYVLDVVETLQYDTIYHEHLRYYSLGSLIQLFKRHGLEVFHVKRIPTHGGSVRVYAARAGQQKIEPSVAERLAHEKTLGLTDGSAFASFRKRVIQSRLDLLGLLAPIKRHGQRIYGVGAPSRASTLIAYTGLDDGLLECVLEISTSKKVGKYIPGTRIPVLDEAKLFSDQPEYALLLSWHIAPELIKNLRGKGFRGKFITPLPVPAIMEG